MSYYGNAEDFEFSSTATPDVSSDEMQKQEAYPQVPPGKQIFVVKGMKEGSPPKLTEIKAKLDGKDIVYDSYVATVVFALRDDPSLTIEDRFQFPPVGTADEIRAYNKGAKVTVYQDGNIKEGKPGFEANKLYKFLSVLGFEWESGGRLPVAATKFPNWKNKPFEAKVKETKYTKDGLEMKGRNEIVLMSYAKPSGYEAELSTRSSYQDRYPGPKAPVGAGSNMGGYNDPGGTDDI